MKRIGAFLLVLVLLSNSSLVFAASSFTNNSALDSAFAQLEKAFMASEQKNYTLEITRGGKTDFKAKMLPKMTNAAIKSAVTAVINEIKYQIERQGEEMGGFTKEDYKKISDHLIESIKTNKGYFQYEDDLKSVYLSFGVSGVDKFYEIDNLSGNFASMGSQKDEVSQADLKVKSDVARYIEQSIQKGNKISPEIKQNLPERTDILFNEFKPSRIIAAKAIASIHRSIYESDSTKYDGSESLESIIEGYQTMFEELQADREKEKKIEYYAFQNDAPAPDVKNYIAEMLVNGELSESFASGFNKAITLDELAKLYFESTEMDENIELEDGTIDPNAPDYIKNAFIYGMIDDAKDLDKPLTRLQAARFLINGIRYHEPGRSKIMRIGDCDKIPIADLETVSKCLGAMGTIGINFEPQVMYTRQQAIMDRANFDFSYIRGYDAPIRRAAKRIIIGKNTIHLLFEDMGQTEEYIRDNFDDTAIDKIKRNGSYMGIDTGCALLEFFTPEMGIKFTFKNGANFIDFDEGFYGPELMQYAIEPRLIKSGEKVGMNIQIDSVYKKIYSKVDGILAKIIKPNMTTEQKIKVIHNYVVTYMTYDTNYTDEETEANFLKAIEKGRGVCGDYTAFFQYLCDRASIPCVSESGDVITSSAGHAWNVVFLNGQWKFVDTT